VPTLIKVPFCLESISRLLIVAPCPKVNEKKNNNRILIVRLFFI
jgi:hypothetical protein